MKTRETRYRFIYVLVITVLLLLVVQSETILAQPLPGDLFREYAWKTPDKLGNSAFLRVGGKSGYHVKPENYPDLVINNGTILFEQTIELTNAIRAEVAIEKMLCHEGTSNLRISLNGNPEIVFPESPNIPEPQNRYMHLFYPTVEIPLSTLKQGAGNYFSLQVDTVHPWRWPQNLVYGVILRVYYAPSAKKFSGQLAAKQESEEKLKLELHCKDAGNIQSVDFLARYDGPDWDGNGVYNDWHYHYHRGELQNHVGTDTEAPFRTEWDLSWVPDQTEPVQLSARVLYNSGLIAMITPVSFSLKRENYSVHFCKPEKVEEKWLTRTGEKEQEFVFNGDPAKVQDARMIFTSWSPGYLNGIYINDFVVCISEGPRYTHMQHCIPVENLKIFKNGVNILKTGKTPKYQGKMVHGAEIMWPGIMVLIKASAIK